MEQSVTQAASITIFKVIDVIKRLQSHCWLIITCFHGYPRSLELVKLESLAF